MPQNYTLTQTLIPSAMNDPAQLNHNQIKDQIDGLISKYHRYLCEEIRVIGLREKVEKRLITLKKARDIFREHRE